MTLLMPSERKTPDEWAYDNREHDETSGYPGQRDPNLTPYIIAPTRAVHERTHKRVGFVCGAQMGKALALDTPLPTPFGWKSMGEVRVGETLFDENGEPCKVLSVSPIQKNRTCYEVKFCDGTFIVADADHKWTVERLRKKRDGKRCFEKRELETITTSQMLEAGVIVSNGRARFSIKNAQSLDLTEKPLSIPAYYFGAWIGDGTSANSALTSGAQDKDQMIEILESEGFYVSISPTNSAYRLAISCVDENGSVIGKGSGNLCHKLSKLGVLNNKHIPECYTRGSKEQRIALLQGLMDTDGGVSNGTCEFTSKHQHIADAVFEIVASLGMRPRIEKRVDKNSYVSFRVRFKAYKDFPVFRFKRKQAMLSERNNRSGLNERRFIRSIKQVKSVPVKCVEIDTPTHLFLAGKAMVPTHNSEGSLDIVGCRLDIAPVPTLWLGPTKQFLLEQWEPRVEAMLMDTPCLKKKTSWGQASKKLRKLVSGVPLRLAHGGSSSAIKSDPFGLAVTDEADELMANVKGAGNPVKLVDKRGDTYADFVHYITSTPSEGPSEVSIDEKSGLHFWAEMDADEIASTIWRVWQSGTQYHWAWPCPHCDEYFIPRFNCLTWEKPTDEDGKPTKSDPILAAKTAYLQCPQGCADPILDEHKEDMLARGVYVAPGQEVTTDGKVVGDPPESLTLSYWVSGLCSPFKSFGERASEYVEAVRTGDQDEIQAVVNGSFGELYAPGSGSVPLWEELEKLKSVATPFVMGEILPWTRFVTLACDVQKKSLIYGIRAWGPRGTSHLVQCGELFGNTADEDVWEDLEMVILDKYHGFPIKMALIDSGFRPGNPKEVPENRVYSFCQRHARICRPTKGRATIQGRPVKPSQIEARVNWRGKLETVGIELLNVDTDFLKRTVHERLSWPIEQPGAFLLPDDVPEYYLRQLVSEARIQKPGKKPVWVQRSKDNHFFDVEAMQVAAGWMLGAQRIPDHESDAKRLARIAEHISDTEKKKTFADYSAQLNK